MGWNTAIVVLNDCLDEIEHDPEWFVEQLSTAIRLASVRDVRGVRDCVYVPGQTEIAYTGHADGIGIIAVGGNKGVKLGCVLNVENDGSEATTIEILRQLTAQHGYTLTKKRKRR